MKTTKMSSTPPPHTPEKINSSLRWTWRLVLHPWGHDARGCYSAFLELANADSLPAGFSRYVKLEFAMHAWDTAFHVSRWLQLFGLVLVVVVVVVVLLLTVSENFNFTRGQKFVVALVGLRPPSDRCHSGHQGKKNQPRREGENGTDPFYRLHLLLRAQVLFLLPSHPVYLTPQNPVQRCRDGMYVQRRPFICTKNKTKKTKQPSPSAAKPQQVEPVKTQFLLHRFNAQATDFGYTRAFEHETIMARRNIFIDPQGEHAAAG